MKKKRIKRLLIIAVCVIALSNFLHYQSPLLRILTDDNYYAYSNRDGTFYFVEMPPKMRNFELAKRQYEFFKKDSNQKDDKLYRLFWRNPLVFWRWYKFFQNDERYDLPYLNPNELPENKK